MNKKFSILSFKYAYEGLVAAVKEEPNLKFHFLAGIFVLASGFFLQISKTDWLFLIILIGFVIAVELTNTAIEAIVDGLTSQHHPSAKIAKDISAGAVLVSSITSAIIGTIIFFPYIKQWIM